MNIRGFFLVMWNLWDPIYFSMTRLRYIERDGERTIIRARLMRYRGKPVVLSDGTVIGKNDLLIKIHLHNAKLLKELQRYNHEIAKGKAIYRHVRETLPSVAAFLESHRRFSEIKGIVGITTLHKGSGKLGFEAFPIHNRLYKYYKLILLFPIYILSSRWFFKQKMSKPAYLFMSKNTLLQRYGK